MMFLATLLTLAVVADDSSADAHAHLQRDIRELDRQIVHAQQRDRASSSILVPLPHPLRADTAVEYRSLFVLTPEEERAWNASFLEYQSQYRAVQDRLLPEIWKLAADGVAAEGYEAAALSKERHQLLQRFDRDSQPLEETLFSRWRTLLEESEHADASLIQLLRYDRLRRRYSVTSQYSLPEASPDLFTLTERHAQEDARSEAVFEIMLHYAAQRGSIMRDRFRAMLDVRPRSAQLIAEHIDGKLSLDEFVEQRSQVRRRIMTIDERLERLNRQTLIALGQVLDKSRFDRIRRDYMGSSYPELLPDEAHMAFREQVAAWLEAHAEPPGNVKLMESVLDDYQQWYDARIRELKNRITRAQREFFLHLTYNALEADEREQLIAAFGRERDQRIERISVLMQELSGAK